MKPTEVVKPGKNEKVSVYKQALVRNIHRTTTKLNPKISIITVTYNSAATIADTLLSVQNQSYNNIEHIIVDGNSQDDTMEIVKSFPHVNKWCSERDGGLYDAMNKGLEMATGDIIGILNSDDIYANNFVLSKVIDCFNNEYVDTLYGDLHYVHPTDLSKVIRVWKSGRFKRSNFNFGWMPPHPTFFVRREVYEKAGMFNLSLKSAADYEVMLRILYKHKFNAAYLPEVLVKMRAGGVSNGSLRKRIRANREDRMAWKMNELNPYFFTLYLKPLRKVFQFIVKEPIIKTSFFRIPMAQ